MLSAKMEEALNSQINAELYSAYVYLGMAAQLQAAGLEGMASWMRIQAKEEVSHAMKIYDYVFERGKRVKLQAIQAPPADWKSPLAVFEAAHKHEQHVTSLIHKLADLAIAENDHATRNMLEWFVSEQVEEEASAAAVVQRLQMVGDHGPALLMLDRELGQREED
jgi:ferritin